MTAPQEKPRLYYDCPLKAAWMAKYFGMRFIRRDGDLVLDWDDMADSLAAHVASDIWESRYTVHPESLHLLEPQDLDVLFRTNGYCQTVGVHIGFPKAKAQIDAGGCIVIRNGKAFHWPESEAA